MGTTVVIGLLAGFGALVAGSVLVYYLFLAPGQQQSSSRNLMNSGLRASEMASGIRSNHTQAETAEAMEDIKSQLHKRAKKGKELSIQERFFQAGIFSDGDKESFYRLRKIGPVVGGVLGFVIAWNLTDFQLGLLMAVVGALCGMQFPYTKLNREVQKRHEDIMYFLPLVIEQIAIGVSSSLDIGPCMSRVIEMADERDTHNPVTELLRFSQNYVKSGATLEEAMTEVGIKSGHNELKHTFMSLAQVAKHGGEVIRQLQELADAVAMQRETKIEERIKKLELKATGPVGLVFVGFMVILLVGFGLQVNKAF